jgi:hypothetical protein
MLAVGWMYYSNPKTRMDISMDILPITSEFLRLSAASWSTRLLDAAYPVRMQMAT